MHRRDFLALSVAGAASLASASRTVAEAGTAGAAAAKGLSAVDDFVTGFMRKWAIPAGSAAISKDGRLVYARGFGYADLAKKLPVTPLHRFRIASSSKPVTAVAIMQLVQERKLQLDEPAFARLPELPPPHGQREDPRLQSITIRHLLEHSGGFDSTKVDPQFDELRLAADAVGHPRPATHLDIIRYVRGRPLAFTPGTKYIYSNFGYNVLGRIIEQTTGLHYGDYIKRMLRPLHIRHMELGRTKPQDRLPDEIEYWDDPTTPTYYSVYEDDVVPRTYSYGGFSMEAIDAHGGWVARPVDLTRFLDAVSGAKGIQLLSASTVREMLARPKLAQYQNAKRFYALGWDVEPGKVVMTHNGALTWGTASTVARLTNGATFALCFNRLGYDLRSFVESMSYQSADLIGSITLWPASDLYPKYA